MAELITLAEIEPRHIFCDVYGLPQKWAVGESWNFIGSPRPDHGFAYIFCDEVYIRYGDGREQYFHRGNLLYIPKGCEYYVEYRNTTEAYSDILVNFKIRDFDGGEYALADGITCVMQHATEGVVNNVEKIAEISTNLKHPALRASKVFYSLLDDLLAYTMLLDPGKDAENAVTPALFYIDHHIGDKISVTELSKMCLLSESAFRKAFRAQTGLSPAQYKIRAKISKAQSILDSTPEISIAEIAEMLGFYDISYFYKSFIAQTGMTPKQYREKR